MNYWLITKLYGTLPNGKCPIGNKIFIIISKTVSFYINSKKALFTYNKILYKKWFKVCPHLHANTNEAGRGEAYANRCLDCNMRQNVVVRRASEWFSLKYWFQADSVHSTSDRTQRQFSSPWLHVYIATHASPRSASRTFLF